MKKVLTVGLIVERDRILLGMKKKGFGEGWWNGFGGKVEKGETVSECMKREFLEEAGIRVSKLSEYGVLNFSFDNDPEVLEVHFFKILKWQGEPIESDEMRPQWFNIEDIPYNSMWPDDQYWLPLFLEGKKFTGNFLFGKSGEILRKTITIAQ